MCMGGVNLGDQKKTSGRDGGAGSRKLGLWALKWYKGRGCEWSTHSVCYSKLLNPSLSCYNWDKKSNPAFKRLVQSPVSGLSMRVNERNARKTLSVGHTAQTA